MDYQRNSKFLIQTVILKFGLLVEKASSLAWKKKDMCAMI